MENNLDIQFKKLRETVFLKDEEKQFYQSEIIKLTNRGVNKEPVLSPFEFSFPKTKMLVAGFAFLLFFSTGLVSSAKSSLPNQYLYVFRIKVIEPVQVFIAWNTKDKNETRIALIREHLEDFSKVSLKEKFSPEAEALFASSFSMEIKEVQEEIKKAAEEENVSDALSSANDLQSVLSAHSLVIDKIMESSKTEEQKTELKDVVLLNSNNLSANIDEGIGATKEIIGNLTSKLQTTEESENLGVVLEAQKVELQTSLDEIKKLSEGLEGEDKDYADKTNEEIAELLKEGEKTTLEDNQKETLNIYNEASQKIGELKTLLNSEKELGIDVLGNSKVEEAAELLNEVEESQ